MTKRTPDDVAKYILGCCTCHDAYKARDLVDPDCAWCEYGGCVVALAEQVAAYEAALREIAGYCDPEDVECQECKHFLRIANDALEGRR